MPSGSRCRYIERELAPHVPAWRAQGYVPRETWRGFGEHGFLLPEMDEQWGGGGGNLAYQLVVQEELTKAEIHAITSVHTIAAHYIWPMERPSKSSAGCPGCAAARCWPALP
jgi:acyl-CoA dehydrogenase